MNGKYAALNKNICQAQFPEKKSKAPYYIQVMQRCARDFSRKTRLVTVPRFGFFPGFTEKVLYKNKIVLYSKTKMFYFVINIEL